MSQCDKRDGAHVFCFFPSAPHPPARGDEYNVENGMLALPHLSLTHLDSLLASMYGADTSYGAYYEADDAGCAENGSDWCVAGYVWSIDASDIAH